MIDEPTFPIGIPWKQMSKQQIVMNYHLLVISCISPLYGLFVDHTNACSKRESKPRHVARRGFSVLIYTTSIFDTL